MPLSAQSYYHRHPLMTLLAISMVLTGIGILERELGGFSQLWPANAMLIGILLHAYPDTNWRHLLVCGAGMVLMDTIVGTRLSWQLMLNSANLATVAIGWWMMKCYAARTAQGEWLATPMAVPQMLLLCQPALLAGSILGGGAVTLLDGGHLGRRMMEWYLLDLFSFSVLLPVVLTLPRQLISWQGIWYQRTYLLPAVGLLLMMKVVDGHLAAPLTMLFTVPVLLWLALSGNLFLTTLTTSVYGVYLFTWCNHAIQQHWGGDVDHVHLLRASVSIMALCGITVASAIAERSRLFCELTWVAEHDYLTGVLNRRAFSALLDKQMSTGQGALLLIDIDYFKRINDEQGHLVGDQVLIALCRRLESLLGADAVLGRMGGEEFALLLRDDAISHHRTMTDRVVTGVAASPLLLDEGSHAVTISAGLAQITAECSARDLLLRADMALYAAKHHGRNRWREA